MIFLGRTHMSEFAYSGLGLNAHFSDPASVWHEQGRRVPGGSSSGAAVSVAEGAALAAIGTDTGGSCRIPAAFNGLVGFKPTASRIPSGGCFPLSPSLDSIGPIGKTVECCAILDRLLSGERATPTPSLRSRLLLPTNLVCDDMDADVAAGFASALERLVHAGFEIVRTRVSAFDMLPDLTAEGGLVAIEAYELHQDEIAMAAGSYDPRTLKRMMMGADQPPQRPQALLALRQRFIAAIGRELDGYDCLIAPTSPILPPAVEACQADSDYSRQNLNVLRNPSLANLMDGCSISLPIRREAAPVGFMLISTSQKDRSVFHLGQEFERIFNMMN
jgi:aspartyl-tRNA(Asn)/glutamyl-tRNA(Gln) amidotransferase subunit A